MIFDKILKNPAFRIGMISGFQSIVKEKEKKRYVSGESTLMDGDSPIQGIIIKAKTDG